MMTFRSNSGYGVRALLLAGGFAASLGAAVAGEADVVDAQARLNADGTFRIEASVSHDDTGWEHYADLFELAALDGTVLATRVLMHPHVGEQPFTRGLYNVEIPAGIRTVTVRAHDLVHAYGGQEFQLDLPGR